MAERLVLPILQSLLLLRRNRSVSLDGDVLRVDGKSIDLSANQWSVEGYKARVHVLARHVGLPQVDLPSLENVWRDGFRRHGTLSRKRLIELAWTASTLPHDETDSLATWEQCFKLLLSQRRLHYFERVSPKIPKAVSEQHLELSSVLGHVHRLLTKPQFACAESPFETVPPLRLDDVWVDPHFVDMEEEGATPLQGSLHESIERRYRTRLSATVSPEFLVERLHGFTVLIGDPGIGKTTFLKWLARYLIRHPEGRYLLPLFVPLRRYALTDRSQGILQFALAECGVGDSQQRGRWAVGLSHLAGKARENVILLLDGWDEIPSDEKLAAQLLREIRGLCQAFTVVVTSRPWAAYPLKEHAEQCHEICELSPESVVNLIQSWHEHAKRPAEDATTLLAHLDEHPDLRRLARNPFLLIALCGIHSIPEDRGLPQTRGELYRRALELIGKNAKRRTGRSFSRSHWRVAERPALWLLCDAADSPRYVFDSGDVQQCCGSRELLGDVFLPSRLVTQWHLDRETLYFVHTTIHEYLAAQALLRKQEPGDFTAWLEQRAYDAAWLEVFAFLAEESSAAGQSFWQAMSQLAKNPDRFGLLFTRLARFLRAARVKDGGQALLGTNVREELWERIEYGLEAECFMRSSAELDPVWYADRSRQYTQSDEGNTGRKQLRADLIRSLQQLRTVDCQWRAAQCDVFTPLSGWGHLEGFDQLWSG